MDSNNFQNLDSELYDSWGNEEEKQSKIKLYLLKTASYFTSKISLFKDSRELQLGTSMLWEKL